MGKRQFFGMVLVSTLLATSAVAQERRGPQIITPADGATVSGPVTVSVGFPSRGDGQGGPPGGGAGGPPPNGGGERRGPRLILFVDAPAPQPGATVQPDATHVPFEQGQRQVTVTLKPGTHSLQLVMLDREGNVSSRGQPSEPSKITVK